MFVQYCYITLHIYWYLLFLWFTMKGICLERSPYCLWNTRAWHQTQTVYYRAIKTTTPMELNALFSQLLYEIPFFMKSVLFYVDGLLRITATLFCKRAETNKNLPTLQYLHALCSCTWKNMLLCKNGWDAIEWQFKIECRSSGMMNFTQVLLETGSHLEQSKYTKHFTTLWTMK